MVIIFCFLFIENKKKSFSLIKFILETLLNINRFHLLINEYVNK